MEGRIILENCTLTNALSRLPLTLAVLILTLGLFGLSACSEKKSEEPAETKAPATQPAAKAPVEKGPSEEPPALPGIESDGSAAVLVIAGYGEIRIEFLPSLAPNHVENFKQLARDGFYNGTQFHRVIPGFMIQGGDPNTKNDDPSDDGMGGPGYNVDAEFSDLPHVRGVVSMARTQDINSAGSQFFIVSHDSNHLDGHYTIFGRVVSGMDVVDQISQVQPSMGTSTPKEPVVLEEVRIEEFGD
jgi:peptidyl-prolyl cis-trans isomerase B (cyclophilin B)